MAVYKDENKTKDGRCWYFKVYKKDFEGNNKAFKSKRYLTKKEAQEGEIKFITEKKVLTKHKFTAIAELFLEEISKIRKESTYYSYTKDYINHIKPFFDKYYVEDVNCQIIKIWAQWLENKGLSVGYMNKIYNVLKSIFDHAMKNYELPYNPVKIIGRFQQKNDRIIKDEEKIRYITYEDFERFISVIDDILWKTFFIFLYYTGMRKGEVLALTWNDIDFNKDIISVNKTLYSKIKGITTITSTKNNKNRKIKISRTLKEQLITYKKEIAKYADFSNDWFVFGCSRFLPLTNIDNYKHKYFLLSGVKEITIHEFRHSHVSLLINEYVKSGQTDTAKFFLMMSNRMGHSVDVMQKVYLHLFPTIQDEIVDILDNL